MQQSEIDSGRSEGWWRRWFMWIMIGSFVICLPSLGGGFLMDDYLLLGLLDGTRLDAVPWWDAYTLVEDAPVEAQRIRSTGLIPWWSSEHLRISFFRPLSSGFLALERAMFGNQAWLYHLDSVLIYVGLVAAVGLLYRRLLPAGAAVLALWVFAFNDAHAMPLGWLANRHAVSSLLAGTLGLIAHIRWREQGWRPGAVLAPVGLAVALAAGETAMAVMGYLVAYELLAGRGSTSQRGQALVPTLALAAIYLATYVLGDYGVTGSGLYLNPVGQPFAFIQAAPGRMAALLAGGTLGAPVGVWVALPASRPWMVALGIVGTCLLVGALSLVWNHLDERARKSVAWLGVGGLLALVPVAATFPLDRLLLGTNLGLAPAVAVLIQAGWTAFRRRLEAVSKQRVFFTSLGALLALRHLALAPVFLLAMQGLVLELGHDTRALSREAELMDLGHRDAIIVTAPDYDTSLYLPWVRVAEGREIAKTHAVLTVIQRDLLLTRPEPDTLVLTVQDGAMLQNLYTALFRAHDDPVPDQVSIESGAFIVRVLERDGHAPTKVAFRFHESVDDDSLVFLRWHDGKLRRMTPPPVGGRMELPYSPGTGLAME